MVRKCWAHAAGNAVATRRQTVGKEREDEKESEAEEEEGGGDTGRQHAASITRRTSSGAAKARYNVAVYKALVKEKR